jgi:hypothetical protein
MSQSLFPLSINVEYDPGQDAGYMYVKLKNNSDILFPGNRNASEFSGLHFLLNETGGTPRVLSWGWPLVEWREIMSDGLEPGEELEIPVRITHLAPYEAARDQFQLLPDRDYVLSIGYGYMKPGYPTQRLVGLSLKTDSSLNIEIAATATTHSEFVPAGLIQSEPQKEGLQPQSVRAHIASISKPELPDKGPVSSIPNMFGGPSCIVLTVVVLAIAIWYRKKLLALSTRK